MPVRRYISRQESPLREKLVSELTGEWRTKNSKAPEPVILEEPNRKGEIEHIYVIWSKWADLDRAARGEIIMDAAEKVKSTANVTKITIAMGLTPEEADRYGLSWRAKEAS